ncbi:hypothetical protein CBR_g45183 [Chara braunii]|uniref:Amino acid transporter transmembrane domain-containing protein n=1 Tax=Chara braunii TaxID=69332 RepID=A0A388K372_CHABU|nr:hypothetical protein CBR_g45183 [Chara braunii]|eukprot:GBG64487.1 hypothetical protein CBR_g45183 [Chara braunii]
MYSCPTFRSWCGTEGRLSADREARAGGNSASGNAETVVSHTTTVFMASSSSVVPSSTSQASRNNHMREDMLENQQQHQQQQQEVYQDGRNADFDEDNAEGARGGTPKSGIAFVGINTDPRISVFNLANSAIGSGMLAFPYAFKHLGIGGGCMFMLFVYLLEILSLVVTVRAAAYFGCPTFQDLVGVTLGPWLSVIVNALILVKILGALTSYLIVTGDIFHPLAVRYLDSDLSGSLYVLTDRGVLITAIATMVLLPLCLKRTLQSLKYSGFLSVTMLSYLALTLLAVGLQNLVSLRGRVPEHVEYFNLDRKVFTSVGIFIFAFNCNVQCVPIFAELSDRAAPLCDTDRLKLGSRMESPRGQQEEEEEEEEEEQRRKEQDGQQRPEYLAVDIAAQAGGATGAELESRRDEEEEQRRRKEQRSDYQLVDVSEPGEGAGTWPESRLGEEEEQQRHKEHRTQYQPVDVSEPGEGAGFESVGNRQVKSNSKAQKEQQLEQHQREEGHQQQQREDVPLSGFDRRPDDHMAAEPLPARHVAQAEATTAVVEQQPHRRQLTGSLQLEGEFEHRLPHQVPVPCGPTADTCGPIDVPKKWGRKVAIMDQVICASTGICAVAYGVVGIFGYLIFPDVKSDVLCSFGHEDLRLNLVRYGMAVLATVAYPVNHFATRSMLRDLVIQLLGVPSSVAIHAEESDLVHVVLSVGLLASTVAAAMSIPDIGIIMSVVGSTSGVLVVFIIPGLLLVSGFDPWTPPGHPLRPPPPPAPPPPPPAHPLAAALAARRGFDPWTHIFCPLVTCPRESRDSILSPLLGDSQEAREQNGEAVKQQRRSSTADASSSSRPSAASAVETWSPPLYNVVHWIEEEHRVVCPDDDSAPPGVSVTVLAMAFMGRRLQFQPAPQNHDPGTDPNIRAHILYRPGHFSALTFADNSWAPWDNGGRVHTVGNINFFHQRMLEGHSVWIIHQEQYVDEHLQALHPPESNPADSTTNSERTSPQDDGCALRGCGSRIQWRQRAARLEPRNINFGPSFVKRRTAGRCRMPQKRRVEFASWGLSMMYTAATAAD